MRQQSAPLPSNIPAGFPSRPIQIKAVPTPAQIDNSWQNVVEISDIELLAAEGQMTTATPHTLSSNTLGMNFQNRSAINCCPTLNNCQVNFNFYGNAGFGPRS
jgi:hypothetical protein